MLNPIQANITINQGATFRREFTCTNPETGAAIDFSGYTVDAPLKDRHNSKTADFDWYIVANKITITMTEEDNLLLTAASSYTHHYSVTARHPTEPDYRIAEGKAMISAQ